MSPTAHLMQIIISLRLYLVGIHTGASVSIIFNDKDENVFSQRLKTFRES